MQALPEQPCSATVPAKPNHVTVALRRTWRWAGGMQHASSPFIQSTAPKILQNQSTDPDIYFIEKKNINFNRTNNYSLCIAHKSANMTYIQMTNSPWMSCWRSQLGSPEQTFKRDSRTLKSRAGYRVRYFLDTGRIASILSNIEKLLVVRYLTSIPKGLFSSTSVRQYACSTRCVWLEAMWIDQCLTSVGAIWNRTEQSALYIVHLCLLHTDLSVWRSRWLQLLPSH